MTYLSDTWVPLVVYHLWCLERYFSIVAFWMTSSFMMKSICSLSQASPFRLAPRPHLTVFCLKTGIFFFDLAYCPHVSGAVKKATKTNLFRLLKMPFRKRWFLKTITSGCWIPVSAYAPINSRICKNYTSKKEPIITQRILITFLRFIWLSREM